MQKQKKKCSKEKAALYYLKNKEATKEQSKNWYKNLSGENLLGENLSGEKKTRLKSIKEKDICNWFSTKKKHYKTNKFSFDSI